MDKNILNVWNRNNLKDQQQIPENNFTLGDIPKIGRLMGNFSDSSIAISSRDSAALIDMNTNKPYLRLLGHTSSVESLAKTTAAINLLMTSSRDKTAKIFDVRTPIVVVTLYGHTRSVNACCFGDTSSTGLFAFTGADDERVITWDLRMNRALYELSTGNNSVIGLHWHRSSRTLFAATENTAYTEIKIKTGEVDNLKLDDRPWPKYTFHKSDDFKHVWDAKFNGFITYTFDSNPQNLVPGI